MPDTKELDTKLQSSLRQAKSKPMYFAFVAKGMDGTLLVDKKKIPPKDVTTARKELGGGLIFRGRVQGDDGQMVFDVSKEPPEALAKQLKKVIKKDAGLTLDVVTRFAQDLAEEGEEREEAESSEDTEGTVPPAPPPPPPPSAPPQKSDAAVRFTARVKALTPVVQKVEAINNPQVKDIKQAMKEALGFAAKNDYAQANETLDIVEPMLKELLASVAGKSSTPPPSPPPPPPPQPQAQGSDVIRRLNALSGDIKAALAGPSKAQVQTLFVSVNGLVKNKDFVQADKVLQELEELLSAQAEAPPPSEEQDTAEEEFTEAWAKATNVWNSCIETVDGQINKLRAAMQQQANAEGDDELLIIAEEGLPALTEDHKTPVMKAVFDVARSRGPARKTAVEKGLTAVEEFRDHINNDERVATCDEECSALFGVDLTIRTEITRGLDALEKALNKYAV